MNSQFYSRSSERGTFPPEKEHKLSTVTNHSAIATHTHTHTHTHTRMHTQSPKQIGQVRCPSQRNLLSFCPSPSRLVGFVTELFCHVLVIVGLGWLVSWWGCHLTGCNGLAQVRAFGGHWKRQHRLRGHTHLRTT